jgi:lysozyme
MTLFFPDVSEYDTGIQFPFNTPVVMARATLSSSVADKFYPVVKDQAKKESAFFAAYHWLNYGNLVAQAHWAFDHVGKDIPLMIDAEDVSGNTGYAGPLTVDNILGFCGIYRSLGGICNLVYLPHWYWKDHMGSPDLTPLIKIGLHLVASEYRSYSDTNWPIGYGGMAPEIWQYTDHQLWGGKYIDFNAFKGTVDAYMKLAMGGFSMTVETDVTSIRNDMNFLAPRVEAVTWFLDEIRYGPEAGMTVGLVETIKSMQSAISALTTAVAAINIGGPLTDTDKALVQKAIDAVTALNNRLESP